MEAESEQEAQSLSEMGFHCHLVALDGAAACTPAPEIIRVIDKQTDQKGRASQVIRMVKNLATIQETWGSILG